MHLFLSFLSGVALFPLFRLFPVSSAALFFAAAVLLTLRRRYLLVPLVIAGFLYASVRHVPPVDFSSLCGKTVFIDAVVRDPARTAQSGKKTNVARVGTAVDSVTGEGLGELAGREMDVISDEGLEGPMRYRISVKVGNDTTRLSPGFRGGERPYALLNEIQGAEPIERGLFNRIEEKREKLNLFLKEHFDGDAGALIASITTGERSGMSEETRCAFASTGLAHLLSISGTHFGLFSVALFAIFRLCINLLPYGYLQRFTIYLTPSQAAALLSLPFMLIYLFISGSSIPAVRSFVMMTIFLGGLLLGRKGAWLNSLLFAAFIICLWDPSALTSLSFELSFLAVLFIGLSVGDREEGQRDQKSCGRILRALKKTVLLSLAASLGTAPLVAWSFHYFSVVSPLSNLVITPLVGFTLLPLSLLSTFFFLFFERYPFQDLISLAADASLKGVKLFASIPFADVPVPAFPAAAIIVFYAGCVFFVAGRKKYAFGLAVLAAGILLALVLEKEKGFSVTYLDVGQGDSAVIEASGATIVVDTGRTGRELDAYLRYRGKRAIDALILTHADDDHSGGTTEIVKRYKVREVWDSGLLLYPDHLLDGVTHRALERGDEVSLGGSRFLTLHPYRGFYSFDGGESTEENNDSLVVRMSGKRSFLFAADAEREAEEDMAHLGRRLKSDVIKIAHHGSRTSTTTDFLRAVSPDIAVISVGRNNSYGHPHREAIERLQGVRVCRTDRDGAVKITETAEGLEIKTYRELEFEEAKDIAAEGRNLRRLFMVW